MDCSELNTKQNLNLYVKSALKKNLKEEVVEIQAVKVGFLFSKREHKALNKCFRAN